MRMRRFAVLVIFAGALSATPGVVGAQTAVDPYYEFLNARRLAARGDVPGALAALQRAATADPRSASIRAEVSSLYFDNNRRAEAEEAAQAALALDANNALANRVLEIGRAHV